MDSHQNPKQNQSSSHSLYPQVIQSNPESVSPFLSNPKTSSSSSSLYPSVDSADPLKVSKPSSSSTSFYPSLDMKDLVDNLFPDHEDEQQQVLVHHQNNSSSNHPTAPIESVEEVLVKIPGALVHLIDKQHSVELACGDLIIVRLRQNQNVVAVLLRIGDEIQWPLAKDEAAVKLDDSHYFFTLRLPSHANRGGSDSSDDERQFDNDHGVLNYGLTIASKGQENLLKELDGILEHYSSFSVQKVSQMSEVLDGSVAKEISPTEMKSEKKKKDMMEERSAAYWTTLAPNVEDYSGSVARAIAAGSGQLIKGILWCGDVTVNRLKWGNEFLKMRMDSCGSNQSEVSPQTLRRIKRVKKVSKMSEKVAIGVLSGVVKVSGFFTSSLVNSKAGKKFFSLLPGEIVLASLDGFNKVFDAVEVAGKNVMSTTSVVTTGLVSHKYGDKAAEATNEGLDAAGHAIGTAWAVLKIRKALNPKSAIKPTTLVKSAAKAAATEVKKSKSKK
ncbi:Senescence/spartin-associated [Macleaya cordata]|uniref:Senescence/spartin-associated n=1 Tax=Macleaya cordata TaxID=56857 RepID=A0A200RAU1_MACCD|nr:Senescence/spartin-associated [Macleaya cordata]